MTPQPTPHPKETDDPERQFWLRLREAKLIELAAIEDRLGMCRSAETRKERRARDRLIQHIEGNP